MKQFVQYILTCFLLVFAGMSSFAQYAGNDTIYVEKGFDVIPIRKYHVNQVEEGKYDSESKEVLADSSGWKFIKKRKRDLFIPPKIHDSWAKFNLKNNTDSSFHAVLELGTPNVLNYTLHVGERIIHGGNALGMKDKEVSYRKNARTIHFKPYENKEILLYYNNNGYRSDCAIKLHSTSQFSTHLTAVTAVEAVYYGSSIIMVLLLFLLFFKTRNSTVFYFVLYAVCLLLFNAAFEGFLYMMTPVPWTVNNNAISFFVLLLMIFNFKFFQSFLKTKEILPKFNQVVNWTVWATLIIVPFTLFDVTNRFILAKISLFVAFPLTLVSIGSFLSIRKNPINGTYYLIGYLFIVFGAVTTILSTHDMIDGSVLAMNSMKVASSLEIICLTYGIIVAFLKEQKEQRDLNEERLKSINELTLAKNVALEKQSKLDKKVAASQMNALRAQMNPHFMFNTLNSVQNFIYGNQKEESVKYLAKFSTLMRKTLDQSRSETVTIEEEVKLLTLYMELENLRFKNAFDFNVEIDDSVDMEFSTIPSMVVQPFIENSILHGIRHKKDGRGKIDLLMEEDEEDNLIVTIQDNGVGLTEAKRIKATSLDRNRKSHATSITQERIQVLKDSTGRDFEMNMEELFHEDGTPAGTKVVVKIPII